MIEKIKIKFLNNNFLKNIMLLASGSIIAQGVAVLCAPIITRLYNVDEIGMYSYLIAIVSTFTAVMNGRYDMAIVSETEEKDIFSIIKLSTIIGVLVSVFATIIFGVYFGMYKPEYKEYRYTIVFFFIILLSSSFINIFNSYNNRQREYKVMTSMYVVRTCCQNIGGILMGVFHLGVFGLIFPYSIGQFFGMKKQSKTLKPFYKDILHTESKDVKKVAKRHKQLPMYSVPAMFANSFSYSSVTIFMESLFDMATVGYYSLSTRILGLPLSLVSGNVSKVFFQEAAEEHTKKGTFYDSFKKTFIMLFIMSIPMGIVMYWLSPWACKVFFGESWVVAGSYIRILTPYYMLRFIGTAVSPALIVCNMQKKELMIQVFLVITSVVAFVITYVFKGTAEMFLICICITKSLVYLLLIIIVWRESKHKHFIN